MSVAGSKHRSGGRALTEARTVECFGGAAPPGPTRTGVVIGRYKGTVVVTVHGELNLPKTAHLGHVLADLIDGQGNLSVVVDLRDATATDAVAAAVFAGAAERAHRRGGTMMLSTPPAVLHEALWRRGVGRGVVTALSE